MNLAHIDLKNMDNKKHKEWTGVDNQQILNNIQIASRMLPLIIRVPVISGFNDSDENAIQTAEFVKCLDEKFKYIETDEFGNKFCGRIMIMVWRSLIFRLSTNATRPVL